MRKEIYAEMVLAQKVLEMAKGNDGEIVSWNESESNVHEEVLRRNARAGYCNGDGSSVGAGKGDGYRPVNRKKYDKECVRVFGKTKLNIWPRDSGGNLIDD